MIKTICHYFSARFADWISEHHPDYPKIRVKLGGTDLAGCDVYSKKTGDYCQSWIVVGGNQRSTSIVAMIYWTTEGRAFEQITGWDTRKESRVPATGGLQLTDEVLVGNDLPSDGRRLLLVDDPPSELLDKAFAVYTSTDLYRRIRGRYAEEIRRKRPLIGEDELNSMHRKEARSIFRTWWDIEANLPMDDATLQIAAGTVLAKVYYLFERYGIPFLEAQIDLASRTRTSAGPGVRS